MSSSMSQPSRFPTRTSVRSPTSSHSRLAWGFASPAHSAKSPGVAGP